MEGKMPFWLKLQPFVLEKMITTLFFKKIPNVFAEIGETLLKMVIITLTQVFSWKEFARKIRFIYKTGTYIRNTCPIYLMWIEAISIDKHVVVH
jgi:hypothetical protein